MSKTYSTMSDHELAAAIAATEAAIRCPRTRGAFLDRMVAAGDKTWTHAKVISACRTHLALLTTEQASRSTAAAA